MTANSTPPTYASVNGPLVWVFYDANSINPLYLDYKYVGEVWVDGVKVYTERAYPRPGGSFGIFDFSPIIRNYVVPVYLPAAGVVAQQLGSAVFRTPDVVIKVREDYNGATGAVVLTDSARIFYNNYNDRNDGLTGISPLINKPLTVRDRAINLTRSCTKYFIPYFATSTTPYNVVINGTTTAVTPSAANTCQMINIAPIGLSLSLESYVVSINGQVYNVNIVCDGLYTNYYLHFLNKYGAFESMLFNKVRKRSFETKRKEYQQPQFRVSNSGVVSLGTTAALHEQRTQFAGEFTERLRIQTDLLTDTEWQWLSQVVNSPMAYLEDAGTVYPIIIGNNNYEFKEYVVDKLNTLQLEIQFGTQINTQYR